MKIAIVTDIHFGVRKDDPFYMKKNMEWLENDFFPALKKHNVRKLINLGDTFDNRLSVSTKTLYDVKHHFMDMIDKLGIEHYAVIGNHDSYYKNTNKVNHISLISSDNVCIVDNECVPVEDFLLVPWINSENHDSILNEIEDNILDKPFLAGHFQIEGIPIVGGLNKIGLKQSLFKSYEKVLSGHFHNPSITGNIWYIGSPLYHTWADYGYDKCFYIFDTKDKSFTPIYTSDKVFFKDELDSIDCSLYKESVVRLSVNGFNEDNKKKLDDVLNSLHANGCRVEVVDVSDSDDNLLSVEYLDDDDSNDVVIESKEFITEMVSSMIPSSHSDKEDIIVDYMCGLLDKAKYG